MTTGERIKQLRKKMGMSAETLADRCGVSPATIYRYEKGDIENMGTDKLTPIAAALYTTPAYLMGWQDGGGDAPVPVDLNALHRIPILGRISAGLPLLAEENVEGYTYTDLNGGADYFALRVKGDSMDALGIRDGYRIIVRVQEQVENGDVAVVLVGADEATVKRFYATDTTVTLLPQSTNPAHLPQIYDTKRTPVRVLGKVVKVEFSL